MDDFNKESDFEAALITALQRYGWEKDVLKNPTEQDLLQNWANILFENNRDIDRLGDYPLIQEEMEDLLEQIRRLRTPLKLDGFINGKTVSITRKNPDDTLHYGKEVSLKIYDRMEIAAGQSRYQIVQQPRFVRREKVLQDNRGYSMINICFELRLTRWKSRYIILMKNFIHIYRCRFRLNREIGISRCDPVTVRGANLMLPLDIPGRREAL